MKRNSSTSTIAPVVDIARARRRRVVERARGAAVLEAIERGDLRAALLACLAEISPTEATRLVRAVTTIAASSSPTAMVSALISEIVELDARNGRRVGFPPSWRPAANRIAMLERLGATLHGRRQTTDAEWCEFLAETIPEFFPELPRHDRPLRAEFAADFPRRADGRSPDAHDIVRAALKSAGAKGTELDTWYRARRTARSRRRHRAGV